MYLVVSCSPVRIPVSLPPRYSCITSHTHTDPYPSNTSSVDRTSSDPFSVSLIQEGVQRLVQLLLALPRPFVLSAHLSMPIPGSPPPRTTDTISRWSA